MFLSYARTDAAVAERLISLLETEGISVWQDLREIGSDDTVWPQIEAAIKDADHLIVLVTKSSLQSDFIRHEWRTARKQGATVVPVLGEEMSRGGLPRWLRREEVYRLDDPRRQSVFFNTLRAPPRGLRAVWDDGLNIEHMVSRSAKLEEAKRELLSDEFEPIALTSVLAGRGGYGKSMLAAAIAQDDEIRDAFIDGVFWVEVGLEAENVLPMIDEVIRKISGKSLGTTDENQAAQELKNLLHKRDVLLIADDIWTESQLRPFLHASENASLLVTTRNREIRGPSTKLIEVDKLTPDEALELISRDLSPNAEERKELAAFAKDFWNWAQLLAICNRNLIRRIRRGRHLTAALDQLREAITINAVEQTDHRGMTLSAALDLGFDDLTDTERKRLSALSVLPEDAGVPIDVLKSVWAVDIHRAEDICIDLEVMGWMQTVNLDEPVRLHDNVLWYLRNKISGPDQQAAHAAFLTTNIETLENLHVAKPPDFVDTQSQYLWNTMLWHLRGAGQDDLAEALLTDFDWLSAKLAATDPQVLYRSFIPEPKSEEARRVARVLGISLPALQNDTGQLAWMLSGRLANDPGPVLQRLVTTAQEHAGDLQPVWHGLARQSAELLRIAGHEGRVQSVAFSPDGTRLLSGSSDGTLRLWDAQSGAELQRFDGHEGSVQSVAFSPDGTRLLSGSEDRTLRLWDAQSGTELQRIKGHEGSVFSVAFSPDGTRLLSGSNDGTLRLWDAQSGAELRRFDGHEGPVWSVAFSPDGTRLLSGSDDGTLRLWDAQSGTELQRFDGHEGLVQSVAFSPDGTRLLSGSWDSTLRLCDAQSGAELQQIKGHEGWVFSVAFSPDGTRLLSGSNDGTLRLWDAQSGTELQRFDGHEGPVWSVAFSPDGTRLLSGGYDGILRLWDAQSGAELQRIDGHEGTVRSVAFSPDGTRLLSGSEDRTLRFWDAQSGTELQRIKGHEGSVFSVAFSPDGTRLLSGSEDRTLRLWDAQSGTELQRIKGHEGSVFSVAFSPDGTRLLSGSEDGTLRLWDAQSGTELQRFDGHEGRVYSVAFSPDGTRLLSGGVDRTLRLWDAQSGTELQRIKGHEGSVFSVAFSPDGTRLLSGSVDRTLRLWDAQNGAELQRIKGHEGSVYSVAFSPDGTRLLSGSEDGTLRLWDAQSGTELQRRIVDASVTSLAVNSRYVVIGDAGGQLHCFSYSRPQGG